MVEKSIPQNGGKINAAKAKEKPQAGTQTSNALLLTAILNLITALIKLTEKLIELLE